MSKTNLPINYIKVPATTKKEVDKEYGKNDIKLPDSYPSPYINIKKMLKKSST